MKGQRYERRFGGGCLVPFGLPFLCGGLAVMASPWTAGARAEPATLLAYLPLLGVGGLCAAVGAALCFGRAGILLDPARREVETWWGLLGPFRTTRQRLDEFGAVTLRAEMTKGSSPTEVFPVRLEGKGDRRLDVASPGTYHEARVEAELVAKAAGFDVHDFTGVEPVVRELEHLDENLSQRHRRLDTSPKAPGPPPGGRIRLESSGRAATIALPPPGVRPADGFGAGCAVVFAALTFFFFVIPFWSISGPGSNTPPAVRYGFGAFALLFALGPVLGSLKGLGDAAATRTTLSISRQRLTLRTERPLALPREEHLEAERVEEVLIRTAGPWGNGVGTIPKELTVLSDERAITCGHGLAPEELTWLRGAVEHYLVIRG